MHIDISGHGVEVTPALHEYIKERMGALQKLVDRFDMEGAVKTHVVIERTTAHHAKGEVYRASIDLHLPGETIHAEESHEDARAAIDIAKEEVEAQVRKYRTKNLP